MKDEPIDYEEFDDLPRPSLPFSEKAQVDCIEEGGFDHRTVELPAFSGLFWDLVHSTWSDYYTPMEKLSVSKLLQMDFIVPSTQARFSLTREGKRYLEFIRCGPLESINIDLPFVQTFAHLFIKSCAREANCNWPWIREWCQVGILLEIDGVICLTERGKQLLSQILSSGNCSQLFKDFYYESVSFKKALVKSVPYDEWGNVLSVNNFEEDTKTKSWIVGELKDIHGSRS